jgi:hypothetical protein
MQIHEAQGFAGYVEMMMLHLLAFTRFSPAIEFVLEFLVGGFGWGAGWIGHGDLYYRKIRQQVCLIRKRANRTFYASLARRFARLA